MGDDIIMILQMIVCLCDGKEAVEHLKSTRRYPEDSEATRNRDNVALDIKTKLKLGELALQHQASAQHQHPKPRPDSGCPASCARPAPPGQPEAPGGA